LTALTGTNKLIDGLLAGLAVAPFFPADTGLNPATLYVDGTNVANEPARAALRFIEPLIHDQAQVLHIYNCVAFPISGRSLPSDAQHQYFVRLIDVVKRALQLRRFRDATLERRLIELPTQVIPPNIGVLEGALGRYVRTWVTPIEPE